MLFIENTIKFENENFTTAVDFFETILEGMLSEEDVAVNHKFIMFIIDTYYHLTGSKMAAKTYIAWYLEELCAKDKAERQEAENLYDQIVGKVVE